MQPETAFFDYLNRIHARGPEGGDADFLARLYASTRMDLHSATADPAFVKSIIEMQQRLQTVGYRQSFPDAQYWVLERAGCPIGRIVIHISASELRLVDIALLPELRGQGLGSHILSALQRYAALHSLALTLAVHHSNPFARRLYIALGFCTSSRDSMAEQMVWHKGQPPHLA